MDVLDRNTITEGCRGGCNLRRLPVSSVRNTLIYCFIVEVNLPLPLNNNPYSSLNSYCRHHQVNVKTVYVQIES